MAKVTFGQMASRIRRFTHGAGPNTLDGAMRSTLTQAALLWSGKVTQPPHMRDSIRKPPGPPPFKRRPSDTGPLRIESGRLAKAAGHFDIGRGGGGGFNLIQKQGFTWRLRKGVEHASVPHAVVHEYGASFSRIRDAATINIPARPYMRPARDDIIDDVKRDAQIAVSDDLRRALNVA